MVFYILAILGFILDQATKHIVRLYVDINERFTLWGIEFTHIENSGMAWIDCCMVK
ncbi:signal peptidase II [Ornithinibacillus halotolerans]|uniref:Signal peptidase II n=1 Tax=Ornithinibacillus halotolerans TaxID=1274357 RepID=A0A916S8V5_9BACI|nr:signal peptidase II [Ornithinibacillus halotolerans]GGA90198.1 hypothetical protein GCM10008025_36010 [Ornithinibacillus halotolerans]